MSVLIVSITLAISLGVSNIIEGQIFLASTGRQSQAAFYAADAGMECAVYWETVHDDGDYDDNDPSPFSTSTLNSNDGIDCGDDDLNAELDVGERDSCVNGLTGTESFSSCVGAGDKKAGRSVFDVVFDGACARVTVIRRQDSVSNPTAIATFIHSDGFSDQDCDSTSPRVFQRSIEVTIYE